MPEAAPVTESTELTTKQEREKLTQLENSITTAFKRINMFDCATMTDKSLILDPTATIDSWRSLLRYLENGAFCDSVIVTMRNFFIGDALNQGHDIFGEEAYCVYGYDLCSLSEGTVNNLRYVARAVPPSVRKLMVHWSTHFAVAPLDEASQKYYLEMAEEMRREEPADYGKRIKRQINEDKILEAIMKLPEEEREKWFDIHERFPEVNYTKLRDMIDGKIPVPHDKESLGDFILAKAKSLISSGWTGGSYEELVDKLMEIATAIKDGEVQWN